jgi:hypothetical protein
MGKVIRTRKQLQRVRRASVEERKAAEKAARRETEERERSGRFVDGAFKGIRGYE